MHKTGFGKREIFRRDEGKQQPVDSKKFYRICNGKGPCLYNLRTDPNQSRNVIEEYPDMAGDLRKKLQNHLQTKIPSLRI